MTFESFMAWGGSGSGLIFFWKRTHTSLQAVRVSLTAPGTFSISAINHVLGAGPFLSRSYFSTVPTGEHPPARHRAQLRAPLPTALSRFQPSTVTARLNGTCAGTIPLLPATGSSLGRAGSPRTPGRCVRLDQLVV